MSNLPLFPALLKPQVESNLRRLNPYWSGNPLPQTPPVKRWAFSLAKQRLQSGLAKATVLRGPRQIGKSTLIRQIIESLLEEGVQPSRILYVQFDELPELFKLSQPILTLADWFEKNILKMTFNDAVRHDQTTYGLPF
jgi:hypothetical protein